MTNKTFIVAVGLAGLTLSSFALVSNYVSKPPVVPVTKPTPAPKATLSIAASPAPKTPLPEKQMYSDLGEAVKLLEQVRTAVLAQDWANAQSQLDAFTGKTQQLPAPQLNQPDVSPVLQDFFALYRLELTRALSEQNQGNARFALNQLYAIVGEWRARLGTRGVPLELVRLNFLVREVELWGELNNETLLRERVKALRETWQELRPLIAARHNGRESVVQFDTLLQRLGTANPPAPDSALISECQQQLEQMDGLFRRPSRAANPSNSPGRNGKTTAEDEDDED